MKWQYETSFACTRSALLALLTDRSFHERKFTELGGADFDVLHHSFDGRRFRIRVRRRMRLEVPVPAFMQKAAAQALPVVHQDSWDLETGSGEIEFEMQGIPVEIRCRGSVSEEANRCRLRYDWDIKAKVPLVGGQLEKLLVADLERKLGAESDFTRRALDSAAA